MIGNTIEQSVQTRQMHKICEINEIIKKSKFLFVFIQCIILEINYEYNSTASFIEDTDCLYCSLCLCWIHWFRKRIPIHRLLTFAFDAFRMRFPIFTVTRRAIIRSTCYGYRLPQ